MPKIKTHSGSKKRFKVTGSGKIIRKKAYKSHLLSGKTRTRKRRLRKSTEVYKGDVKRIKHLIPYEF